jgi:ComF family protein
LNHKGHEGAQSVIGLRRDASHYSASGCLRISLLPGSNKAILWLEHSLYAFLKEVVFSSSALDRAQRVPHRTIQLRDAMKSAVKAASSSVFSILFPSDCRICNAPLTNIASFPVCEACLGKIVPLDGPLCRLCGEKLFHNVAESGDGALCGMCRRAEPRFRRAAAYGAYEGELRDLIHLFKYKRIRPAGKLLDGLLNQAVTAMALPDLFIVIPVPLWSGKRNSRGFNQAEAIARTFMSFQTSGSIQLDTSILVRTRETPSQTGLTRHQRRANVRGAFAVLKPEKVKGRSILIVDDVMTTGTTAGECARVLRRAGAKEIFVATVARATKEAGSVLAMAAGAPAGGIPSGGERGHA